MSEANRKSYTHQVWLPFLRTLCLCLSSISSRLSSVFKVSSILVPFSSFVSHPFSFLHFPLLFLFLEYTFFSLVFLVCFLLCSSSSFSLLLPPWSKLGTVPSGLPFLEHVDENTKNRTYLIKLSLLSYALWHRRTDGYLGTFTYWSCHAILGMTIINGKLYD